MEQLANMTIGQLAGGAAGIFFLLSIFIEIAPIKINPISKFLKWLGKKINSDVIEKVDALEKEVMEMRQENEQQVAINCRYRILRFGDEVLHDVRHSKDHFEQILLDINAYERYCDKHVHFKNNITQTTTEIILERYKKCMADKDFL